jgi:hypothetical protein
VAGHTNRRAFKRLERRQRTNKNETIPESAFEKSTFERDCAESNGDAIVARTEGI